MIRRRRNGRREVINSSVRMADDAYDAARDADAVLILTEWEEFAALDLDRLKAAQISDHHRRQKLVRSGNYGGQWLHLLQRWTIGCEPGNHPLAVSRCTSEEGKQS